jgi:aryl-alcohol dehydrogenase-like predicted oxidoreductase
VAATESRQGFSVATESRRRIREHSGLAGGPKEETMETRKIGSLNVTVVGIGSDNFGGRIDEEKTREVLFAALDAGINFFDTADVYPVVPSGRSTRSEEFMGRVLKGHRQEFYIATKFGLPFDEDHQGGAKPAYIRRVVEESLRRLQTDHIDLYQLHTPDIETPIADTLGALGELVEAGKVIEIGCSNFSVGQLRAARAASAPDAPQFVSVQNELSLLARSDELDVMPECEATGLAYLPFFPLYNGLLTGAYRRDRPWPDDSRFVGASAERTASVFSEHNVDVIESLAAWAEARGHTLLEVAFARLLAHRSLASVIAGATSEEQVRANAATADWRLTPAEIQEIDALAPSTYAVGH